MDIYKEISLVLGVRVTKETFDFKLKRVAASGGFTAKHQEQIIIILVKRLGKMEESTQEVPIIDVEGTLNDLILRIDSLEDRVDKEIKKPRGSGKPPAEIAEKVEPKKAGPNKVEKPKTPTKPSVKLAKKVKEDAEEVAQGVDKQTKPVVKSAKKKSDDKKTDK